jgi:hypothetical protein
MVLGAFISAAWGQQDPPIPNSPPAGAPVAAPATPVVPAAPAQAPAATSDDRLFDLLPNFLTLENADSAPPLSAGGKFKAVAKGAFDWGQFIWYGVLSGISQAENSEPGFHQGAEGYGKRYGAYLADGSIENFMVGAALPSLFHQDPRFYQSSKGTFRHRFFYAASRILITRGDNGAKEFNFSEVVGSALASGISTYSYHPRSDRTIPNTASVWASQVAYDTLSIEFKEFWPDIRKKLHLK